MGGAIITGFSQVAKSKEVRRYFERGRDISAKHFEVFTGLLGKENLSAGALNLTSSVTDSTTAPFSDKLMMYHVAALTASGIGQYGVAMSTSPRRDLGLQYARLSAEIGHFAKDGANIMINNGWMEQPPESANQDKLAE